MLGNLKCAYAVKALSALVFFMFLAGPALAQPGRVDPSRGKELAERLCVTCHNVDASPGNIARTDVASFFSIANRSGQSADRLIGAIVFPPHPAMPAVSFTNAELRDLVGYIMSLRTAN
jgi:mono/diheme cytochrome c family protein